jgi:hypothetical protein
MPHAPSSVTAVFRRADAGKTIVIMNPATPVPKYNEQ